MAIYYLLDKAGAMLKLLWCADLVANKAWLYAKQCTAHSHEIILYLQVMD